MINRTGVTVSIFEQNLGPTDANHLPLSPVSFLRRAAMVRPEQLAIVHGERRYNYAQFYERSQQLAAALSRNGIGKGDCVAIMGANTPEMLEAHGREDSGFYPGPRRGQGAHYR